MKKTAWFILALLLLTACADASPTINPTTSTAATSAAATTLAATQFTLNITTTLRLLPTTAVVATLTPTIEATTVTATTVAPPTSVPPATSAPSPTPAPAQAQWKNSGGANCCLNFNFAGSDRLTYYDKPANGKVGTYTLNLKDGKTAFLTEGFGLFTPDLTLAALSDRPSGQTRLQNLSNGQTIGTLSNAASTTFISPDKKQVAYALRSAQQDGPEAPQRFGLWVANTDGSGARSVWNGREMANLAWLPDNQHLLVTARDAANERFGLWVIGTDGTTKLIVESKGLTVAAASGDGQWVAYWITLQGAERSGVWLARTDGSQARRLDWQGSFRWDDSHQLFYIPVRGAGEKASTVFRLDPTTNQTTRLTDPALLPLGVALDQWQIAPNGQTLAFRNATDNALWLMTF